MFPTTTIGRSLGVARTPTARYRRLTKDLAWELDKAVQEHFADKGTDDPEVQSDIQRFRANWWEKAHRALESYTLSWKSWAASERERRKTITLYGDLFALMHQLEAEQTNKPQDLVWGIGISTWRLAYENTTFSFDYPLLTQAVEISIDDKTMAIELRPRATETRIEFDALTACHVEGAIEVEKAVIAHLNRHKDRPAGYGALEASSAIEPVKTELSVPLACLGFVFSFGWFFCQQRQQAVAGESGESCRFAGGPEDRPVVPDSSFPPEGHHVEGARRPVSYRAAPLYPHRESITCTNAPWATVVRVPQNSGLVLRKVHSADNFADGPRGKAAVAKHIESIMDGVVRDPAPWDLVVFDLGRY